MRFSILHVSDLHRDLSDEIGNPWLLETFERDFEQYQGQDPIIMRPTLCIVSGDLVYGVKPNAVNATEELERQYTQTEDFLIGLADRFFGGNRERVVILPGNHDVSYAEVMGSAQKIDVPNGPEEKANLVADFFTQKSRLRWSWNELCFYKILDEARYEGRFRFFANMYETFYQGRRRFPLDPQQQYDVFDFSDLNFCIVALNSCYNNDPLRRAGAFHPATLAEAFSTLRKPERVGWLTAMAWHHNFVGGPTQDDYLNADLLQLFIDAGVSLGFHGHQHRSECVDERYRIGPNARKMTIISAGTLCAGPHYLQPGEPRSYNVVELDTDAWSGRVHQRRMVNQLQHLPVWGPGYFNSSNSSYIDFEVCKPLASRPPLLDVNLMLERAERLLGTHQWSEAVDVLSETKDVPLARPLLVHALAELSDSRRTISMLWPPQTIGETVVVGGAILDGGTSEEAEEFLQLEIVLGNSDASVRDISRRIRERKLK